MIWITENMGTIIISSILLIIVALILFMIIGDKKKGKSSCGCNCSHCALECKCHKGK